MNHVLEKQPTTTDESEKLMLFVVWADTWCSSVWVESSWEMNSNPQLLSAALDEAVECRAMGYPTKVLPEGMTPRSDGLFSDPATDP